MSLEASSRSNWDFLTNWNDPIFGSASKDLKTFMKLTPNQINSKNTYVSNKETPPEATNNESNDFNVGIFTDKKSIFSSNQNYLNEDFNILKQKTSTNSSNEKAVKNLNKNEKNDNIFTPVNACKSNNITNNFQFNILNNNEKIDSLEQESEINVSTPTSQKKITATSLETPIAKKLPGQKYPSPIASDKEFSIKLPLMTPTNEKAKSITVRQSPISRKVAEEIKKIVDPQIFNYQSPDKNFNQLQHKEIDENEIVFHRPEQFNDFVSPTKLTRISRYREDKEDFEIPKKLLHSTRILFNQNVQNEDKGFIERHYNNYIENINKEDQSDNNNNNSQEIIPKKTLKKHKETKSLVINPYSNVELCSIKRHMCYQVENGTIYLKGRENEYVIRSGGYIDLFKGKKITIENKSDIPITLRKIRNDKS